MAINLYGLTQPIRKPGLGVDDTEQLRFVPDDVWSYQQSLDAIERLNGIEDPQAYAEAANRVVNRALVHVDWNRVDPVAYRQRIPIWENYFLYLLGEFSGLPQFERYHYADYRRNLQRGIGICGDASTILSSLLDRRGIDNAILSYPGHVIVEYDAGTDGPRLLDPDFGVILGTTVTALSEDPEGVKPQYLNAGYSASEIDYLFDNYQQDYRRFDDTYHFMSKRYVFERVSYIAKWALPALLILGALFLLRRRAGTRLLSARGSRS